MTQNPVSLAALLRREKRRISRMSASVSHIIVAIERAEGPVESWMLTRVHRWALSIHRRMQRAQGIDADVTVLLVDASDDAQFIEDRITELAQRPPGVNPAAVLTSDEIRRQTIAQASTSDFI